MKEVIISILTYNKLDYTALCMKKLFDNTDTTKTPFIVVVSDNKSMDGTQKWLKTLGKKIKLVLNVENMGFAKAHNIIMKQYPENDVVLMNNDIEVPPNWLEVLQQQIGDCGAVSPAIQLPNGLDVGARLDSQAKGRSLISSNDEPHWITGSCIYLRADTRKKIGLLEGSSGLLDEQFNFYYEDVDYCMRMKNAGIKFKCIKDVVIVHHNSVSSNPTQKRAMMEKSRQYFIKKYNWK